jgi:TRAP-type transport system small permease protein
MAGWPVALSPSGRSSVGAALRRLREAVDLASYAAIVGLTSVMTTVIVVQVGLRYVFNASIDWADELARLTFVWLVFLAVPHGVKLGVHVGLDFVVKLLPARAAAAIGVVNRVALASFLMVAGSQSAGLAFRNWANEMSTLPLPQGLFFLAVAIGCFHSLFHLVGRPERMDNPDADAALA